MKALLCFGFATTAHVVVVVVGDVVVVVGDVVGAGELVAGYESVGVGVGLLKVGPILGLIAYGEVETLPVGPLEGLFK